jgi:hypothetical protein
MSSFKAISRAITLDSIVNGWLTPEDDQSTSSTGSYLPEGNAGVAAVLASIATCFQKLQDLIGSDGFSSHNPPSGVSAAVEELGKALRALALSALENALSLRDTDALVLVEALQIVSSFSCDISNSPLIP